MNLAKQKERELIIQLHNKGKSVRDIAYTLDIGKSTAAYWITRHRKTDNLSDLPRSGRPTSLTKGELASISRDIKQRFLEPKMTGINSKEVLELIEEKTSRKYTLRHTQRLLHRMGFSLITPRPSHIKKDEKAQEKFRSQFKKNFGKNMWDIQS